MERAKHSFLLCPILLSCLVMNKICLNQISCGMLQYRVSKKDGGGVECDDALTVLIMNTQYIETEVSLYIINCSLVRSMNMCERITQDNYSFNDS